MNRIQNFLPLFAAALVGYGLLGMPAQAHATFRVTITDGTNTVTATDGGAGDLDGTANGVINYSGSVGVFNISGGFSTSNSAANVQPAELTIINTSISSAGFAVGVDKMLTITVSDDAFTAPPPVPTAAMHSQLSDTQVAGLNTTGIAKIEFQSFLNAQAGTKLTLNNVGGTTSGLDLVNIPSSPYTLKNVTVYTVHGQGANTAITVNTTGITTVAVPAPPGLVLALIAVPCVGLGRWLRRRKETAITA